MRVSPEHDAGCLPEIGVVVAMTRKGVIGRGGRLPWDLPADRQLFRRLTEGNTVIMGRLTYESLGAALPNRHNIVLSRFSRHFDDAIACRSFLQGIAIGWRLGRPLYVVGGVDLYRKALLLATTLHVSWVEGDHEGDRFFPPFDPGLWLPVSTTNYPGFQHVVYRRATSVA